MGANLAFLFTTLCSLCIYNEKPCVLMKINDPGAERRVARAYGLSFHPLLRLFGLMGDVSGYLPGQ